MSRTSSLILGLFLGAVGLVSCGHGPAPTDAPKVVARRTLPQEALVPAVQPAAQWDFKPQGIVWTNAALAALEGHAQPLVKVTPADVTEYCPAYPEASPSRRRAFWVGLISALAGHESTWRPKVSGGDGRWHGLLQISPATAKGYGCRATSAEALKSGPANLSCGLRIMAETVPRDGVISRGRGGIAADWGPFVQQRKRDAMAEWTRGQSYCRD
ncbi:MAG: transglycosylase SLT domain-containing protein [Alphaproteobacteria bacterium]|nr:transglycosylase SLT domain-containing protein [Alphaproteobacteria bacterium]NNF24610.1 transglycosylase SLT domain-containing protein [Paracoccaceae bacterium]